MSGQSTLAEVAARMRGVEDERRRLTWVFEFMRGAGDSGVDIAGLIAQEPEPVGDRRFDAFLAAMAEYVAYQHQVPAPEWCFAQERVLTFGWHLAPYPQARRWAYARTPGPFLGRGIYIEERDLANL